MASFELKNEPGTQTAFLAATLDNKKTAQVSWNVGKLDDDEAIVALRALADLMVRRKAKK